MTVYDLYIQLFKDIYVYFYAIMVLNSVNCQSSVVVICLHFQQTRLTPAVQSMCKCVYLLCCGIISCYCYCTVPRYCMNKQ